MFDRGRTYTRAEVQMVLRKPVEQGGAWATGYAEFNERAYIFASVGVPGRTGHDYENRWVGDRLLWQSKGNAARGQAQLDRMLLGHVPVHVFTRTGDRERFIYAGIARAESATGEKPVTVEWSFENGRPTPPLSADALAEALAGLDFKVWPSGSKSQKVTKGEITIYLKRDTKALPLVIHPKWIDRLTELESVTGVWRSKASPIFYHQSTLIDFPLRRHGGKTDVHYGFDFEIASNVALASFISILERHQNQPSMPTDSPGNAIDPITETEATRAARLGQTRFRNDLLARWKGCAVTGITMFEMVRASHIKPWCVAEPRERLDPDNGLPLLVHLDLLFDKGLITFEDDGAIVLSASLPSAVADALGVGPHMRIEGLSDGNRNFLEHHRAVEFKKPAIG